MALMVMVTWSMRAALMRSTQSGSAKPLVDRHSLTSGSASAMRAQASKVRRGSASASPGPAMPTTESCGISDTTQTTLRAASSGVRVSLTTPGRLSLTQSYLRLQ